MTITGICSALLVGAIIGALGRLFVPGQQPIGFWLTILIGIVAALIGAAVGYAIGVGWLLTLIIQIALAAGGVALVTSFARRRV